jgi:hypothetical protein
MKKNYEFVSGLCHSEQNSQQNKQLWSVSYITRTQLIQIPRIFSSLIVPHLISIAPTHTILGKIGNAFLRGWWFRRVAEHPRQSSHSRKYFWNWEKSARNKINYLRLSQRGDRDGIEIEWGGCSELKLTSEWWRPFIETINWNQQRAAANGQRNKRMLACLATDYWHV